MHRPKTMGQHQQEQLKYLAVSHVSIEIQFRFSDCLHRHGRCYIRWESVQIVNLPPTDEPG